jgi:hypothetical protein
MVRESTRERRKRGRSREEAGLLHRTAFDEVRRRSPQTPVRDFSLTAAFSVWSPEGDGRGECRLEGEGVKGADALQEGAGQVGETVGGFGKERGNVGEERADRWVRVGSEREGRARETVTDSGFIIGPPRLGRTGCLGPLLFSFFSSFFLFILFCFHICFITFSFEL